MNINTPNSPQRGASPATITAFAAMDAAVVSLNSAIAAYQNALLADQTAAAEALTPTGQ
jgi:hypothetical protein